MRKGLIIVGAVGVLGAFVHAPSAAHAAGFGPVRPLTPATGSVDSQLVAVGPRGETAVLWRRFGRRVRDFAYVAAVGPSPERLGRPRLVRAGSRAAPTAAGATLLARPDGGFVACFNDDAPHRTAVLGCSFTDARGRFGPLRVVDRRRMRSNPTFGVAMRTDGKVAIVLSRSVGPEQQELRTTTLDARGTRGPVRPLATIDRRGSFDLATTGDGRTAVALSSPRRAPNAPWDLTVRLTAPGDDVFGAAQPFLPDGAVERADSVRLDGGPELLLSVFGAIAETGGPTIVRQLSDGTFSAPLRLPRPGPGVLRGSVSTLPDGGTLAVVQAELRNENDCANTRAAVIGSGPLVPADQDPSSVPVQRLSKPGQIAARPDVAILDDGTAIATWQNATRDPAATRQEVAIRPPGASAFRPSQVLPRLAARDTTLATGGSRAVLAWVVGDVLEGPSRVVVSSLRSSPPYAAPAPLSTRPRTPCG